MDIKLSPYTETNDVKTLKEWKTPFFIAQFDGDNLCINLLVDIAFKTQDGSEISLKKGHLNLSLNQLNVTTTDIIAFDSLLPFEVPSLFLNSKMAEQIRDLPESIKQREDCKKKVEENLKAHQDAGPHPHFSNEESWVLKELVTALLTAKQTGKLPKMIEAILQEKKEAESIAETKTCGFP